MSWNVSTFRHVAHESEAEDLLNRVADERLLSDQRYLPEAVGRPTQIEPSHARGWLVGAGATLTGVTLFGGLALLVAGLVELIANGADTFSLAALVIGALLVATHWGWVHVAEITATGLEGRRERVALDSHQHWLAAIEPYSRYEVSTSVGDDGSITIVRTRHRPIPSGERRFTFATEVELSEKHAPEEPGAVVAERAEALRRQAALDTERERQRFAELAGERETEDIRREQEQRLREALRAESKALSERINANLRDPPAGE